MSDLVKCRSSDQYADTPTVLWWQGEHLPITLIINRWRSPLGLGFRVQTQDERIFDLFYSDATDEWDIVQI